MFLKTDGAGNLSFSSSLPASSVGITQLSATGTPSSSTFLRGDNSWASAGAIVGQVIQVVTATDSTQRSTTSTSFVTGSNTLSVTITPASSSNKIFLIATTSVYTTSQARYTIYKGATNLGSSDGLSDKQGGDWTSVAMSYLDSPATTSATTYQVYFKSATAGTSYLNNTATASLTAFEIKG